MTKKEAISRITDGERAAAKAFYAGFQPMKVSYPSASTADPLDRLDACIRRAQDALNAAIIQAIKNGWRESEAQLQGADTDLHNARQAVDLARERRPR